jgi:hypothetical protein
VSAVYSALVHYPVRDREGQTVSAAVTNIDVHDIARSSHTFGLAGFLVVTPIEAQRQLVVRILEHWRSGAGLRRMPHRSEALAICAALASIEDAARWVAEREGKAPRIVATAARPPLGRSAQSFPDVSRLLAEPDAGPWLILFGTGHGLTDQVLAAADVLVEPIRGAGEYNHLSVRAAAAIAFDRLLASPRLTRDAGRGS